MMIITGSLFLVYSSALLGFNEVAFLADNFLGLPSKLDGYTTSKLGVRQVACTTIPRHPDKATIKKTYTILGAGGFIGSNFINELKRSRDYNKINIVCREGSCQKYQSLFGDLSIDIFKENDQMLETAFCQSDVLINFVSVLGFESDEKKYSSIIFQYKQIQKIIKAEIPLVINVSSQSIYDQKKDIKKKENSEPVLNNLYAFQKYLTEHFFETIELFSPCTKAVSLRFSRVIGRHHNHAKPYGFFVNSIESILNNQNIEINYPRNNTNLIDIRDVIGALFFVVNYSKWRELPNVMNVGGTNISLEDFFNTVIKVIGCTEKKALIKYGENFEIITSSMVDSSLIKSIGWVPKYTLEETIQNIIDQYD